MIEARRCGIYLRVSLDVTGDELAVARQREDCRRIAEARGWVVVGEYVDNDTSASGKVPRPAFERILTDLEHGRLDTVISWSMDRLTRNRRDRLRILEIGEARGLLLSFARGSDLDLGTPSGRLSADILASVARHEIEVMSDRRKRANEQKAGKGLPAGGRRPYGYTRDQRSVVEEEAREIRWCAEQILAGRGLWWIVGDMNRRGVRTTLGHEWRHGELRRLLLNPRYVGRRMHRGVDVGEAVWPAILDPDTFAAIRAVFRDPSRLRAGAPTRYYLSSLAVCGECQEVIHGSVMKRRPTYTCATRRHVSVASGPVDTHVRDWVIGWLQSGTGRAALAPAGDENRFGELRRREVVLRARLGELAEMFAAGDVDREQMRAGTARIREELEAVTVGMREAMPSLVVAEAMGAPDPMGLVDGWYRDDLGKLRELTRLIMRVELFSPGRGARRWRDDQVRVTYLR